MGESGSGKTTAMRTLNPEETYYIDCDGKGLSWKGWREQYSSEKKNYFKTDDQEKVKQVMRGVSEKRPEIKNIVIDTANSIMVADEFRRMREKGYDKWQDLAQAVFKIIVYANMMRDDLAVIFTAHTETVNEDNGYTFTRIKTSGKKLTKICLESKFNTVLLSKCVNGEYLFETQSNNSTAKSPMGAFDSFEIENDIAKVIEVLKEF